MTDSVEQANRGENEAKESLTLWLPATVIKNLNELVLRLSSRHEIKSKSDIVAELVNKAHRKEVR